jgi:hypothetical protein
MNSLFRPIISCTLILLTSILSLTAHAKKPEKTPTWTNYNKAMKEHPHFRFQGEYIKENQGDGVLALQVLSTEGKFYTSLYQGGLPGEGWNGSKVTHQWVNEDNIERFIKAYKKVNRSIRAEDNIAPKGSIVLFDGRKNEKLRGGNIIGDVIQAGFRSTDNYQNIKLHLEYLTPYKPALPISHPDRGNSGIYLNNAYEVQVMDSFAHDSDKIAWQNETLIKKPYTWNATIYEVKEPSINMSLPALHWQSFDIEFTAPSFKDGEKTANARMTVFHNGIKIHDDIEVTKPTRGREKQAEAPEGIIYFQNHHNPVMYRNIWLTEH